MPTRAVRRPRRTSYSSVSGPRPDRVAAWAVALGVFLILVASATSRGATTGGSLAPPPGGDQAAPAGGAAAPSGAAALDVPLAEMAVTRATWYGPGLYGRRTACGARLRRSTLGVAHRRLPCGTLVRFYFHGRFLTVPVIDRGPFTRGIEWDLTAESARRLGLRRTSLVRSLP